MSEAKRWWAIAIVLFLAMSFFSALGFYDNYSDEKITGMASLNVKAQLGGALDLLLGYGKEDVNVLKLLLWIVWFAVLMMGTELVMKGKQSRAALIAGIISLITIRFIPDDVILYIGSMFGAFGAIIFLGLPIVGFYALLRHLFPLKDGSGEKNRVSYVVHIIGWLVLGFLFYGVSQLDPKSEVIGAITQYAIYGTIISVIVALIFGFTGLSFGGGGSGGNPFTKKNPLGVGENKSKPSKSNRPGEGETPSETEESSRSNEPNPTQMKEVNSLKSQISLYLRDLIYLERNFNNGNIWMRVMQEGNNIYRMARDLLRINRPDLQKASRDLVYIFNAARKDKKGLAILNENSDLREQALARISEARGICTSLLEYLNSNQWMEKK